MDLRRVRLFAERPIRVVAWLTLGIAGLSALTLASPMPALACVDGLTFTGAYPTVAVSGTTISGPDANGDLQVAIDGLFIGHLSEPFTLHEAATCGYPMDKLQKGVRLLVVTDSHLVLTAHRNQLNTNESYIWLLDGAGNVTYDMNQTGKGFATLADVLAGFGLPDTALKPPPIGLLAIGYTLIAVSLGLVAVRMKRIRGRR